MKAIVYRKRGPAWEFTPHPIYHRLVHITCKGTIYGIMLDADSYYKPVWIGRYIDGSWVTWEAEIGAMSIMWQTAGGISFRGH